MSLSPHPMGMHFGAHPYHSLSSSSLRWCYLKITYCLFKKKKNDVRSHRDLQPREAFYLHWCNNYNQTNTCFSSSSLYIKYISEIWYIYIYILYIQLVVLRHQRWLRSRILMRYLLAAVFGWGPPLPYIKNQRANRSRVWLLPAASRILFLWPTQRDSTLNITAKFSLLAPQTPYSLLLSFYYNFKSNLFNLTCKDILLFSFQFISQNILLRLN